MDPSLRWDRPELRDMCFRRSPRSYPWGPAWGVAAEIESLLSPLDTEARSDVGLPKKVEQSVGSSLASSGKEYRLTFYTKSPEGFECSQCKRAGHRYPSVQTAIVACRDDRP